jgi:hypothetical protein
VKGFIHACTLLDDAASALDGLAVRGFGFEVEKLIHMNGMSLQSP